MVCLVQPILISSYDNTLFHLRLYYDSIKDEYKIIDDDPFIGHSIVVSRPFKAQSSDFAIEKFNKFISLLTGSSLNVSVI